MGLVIRSQWQAWESERLAALKRRREQQEEDEEVMLQVLRLHEKKRRLAEAQTDVKDIEYEAKEAEKVFELQRGWFYDVRGSL